MHHPTRREFLKLAAAGCAGAAALASSEIEAAPEPADKNRQPNILFLMTDQHRFDCLGCYGNSVIKTPNLDRIARDGIRFT